MPAESNQTYSVEAPEINDDLAILADEPSGGNDEGKAPRQTSQTPGTEDGDDLQEEVEEKPEPEVKEEEADEEEKPESKAKVEESGDDGSLPLSKRLEKISPGILKKVPGLRQTLYREEQFSTHFATPDDAKDAVEHLSALEPIEQGLLTGKVDNLLESISTTSPKLLEQIATDFLPKLYAKNKDVFFKAVDPVVRNLLNSALNQARIDKNPNLENAARWISQYVFNTFDVPPAQVTESKPDPERQRLEQDKQEFNRQRFQAHQAEVLTGSVGTMITTVTKQIDPEGKLTPFMKDKLSEAVMVEIDHILTADTRHMNSMNSLWRRATKANMAPEWKSRIQTTYLARARQALPAALAKVRKEAGIAEPRAAQKTGPMQAQKRNPTPSAGRPAAERVGGPVDPKKVDWSRTSDADLLNDKVTFRR